MLTLTFVLLLVLLLLIVEARFLGRSRERILSRIHVNGTRGKSSVTEYLAAALTQTDTRTMAKITGVIPTLIENGSREPIVRRGSARVQEQFRIIRKAGRADCDHLILECMSIDPALQRLESSYFKPHIYVITNIRDDHQEVMGRSIEQQVKSICDAIPPDCTVVTGPDSHLEAIAAAAALKGSQLVVADLPLAPHLEKHLPEGVFPANMAIVLSICKLHGQDRDQAFQRILQSMEGQDSRLSSLDRKRDMLVLNGFDVNDTASADAFLTRWRSETGHDRPLLVIFNSRNDRPYRTTQFASWLAGIPGLAFIVLTGDHRQRARFELKRSGMDPQRIVEIRPGEISGIRKRIMEVAAERSLVLTIGNIAGDGFKIMEELG